MMEDDDEETRSRSCWEYIFMKWAIYENHTTIIESNVQLATIANVSHRWRTILSICIVDNIVSMDDTTTSNILPQTINNNNTIRPLLLLPSMIRQLKDDILQRNSRNTFPNETNNNNILYQFNNNNTPQHRNEPQNSVGLMKNKNDTFCVAWFPSEGIQEIVVDIPPPSDSITRISETIDDLSLSLLNNTTMNSFHLDRPCTNVQKTTPNYYYYEPKNYSPNPNRSIKNQQQQQQQQQSPTQNGRMIATSSQQQQVSSQQQQHQQTSSCQVVGTSTENGLDPNQLYQPAATRNNKTVTVCSEWKGYRTAHDVLSHFGYTKSFIDDIIERTIQSTVLSVSASSSSSPSYDEYNNRTSLLNPNIDDFITECDSNNNTYYYNPTYAVRGATVARPENYCLCYDSTNNNNNNNNVRRQQRQRRRRSRTVHLGSDSENSSSCNDNTSEDDDDDDDDDNDISMDKEVIRNEERRESLRRYEEHKITLQQTILPICLNRKNNNNDNNNQQQQQKCIQFLNSVGSNAVCMKTPIFGCGPIIEPITILCIGIATEDGCFLSGLNHRFEFGHLYPNNDLAEATDMSPICIATEVLLQPQQQKKNDNKNNKNNTNSPSSGFPRNDSGYFSYRSKSQSNIEITSRSNSTCDCMFQDTVSKTSNESDDDDDDDKSPRFVHRGLLGPGSWHCYTAIVDGINTQIRIDGIDEPISHQEEFVSNDYNHREIKYSPPILDGLTIGSDHCFDMSLCCGDGSDGEGEGAIAELVIFSGRLCNDDIRSLENYLMKKHGIVVPPPVNTTNNNVQQNPTPSLSSSIWIENEFERRAHGLFATSEPLPTTYTIDISDSKSSIPLRYLTRHRSVSWKQTNPVTGQPIMKTRIGHKRRHGGNGNDDDDDDSSSEW